MAGTEKNVQSHAEKASAAKPRIGRTAITVCGLPYLFLFLSWHRRRKHAKRRTKQYGKARGKGQVVPVPV